jgi:hypothetical protein
MCGVARRVIAVRAPAGPGVSRQKLPPPPVASSHPTPGWRPWKPWEGHEASSCITDAAQLRAEWQKPCYRLNR